jgi:hypothetical protein
MLHLPSYNADAIIGPVLVAIILLTLNPKARPISMALLR